MNYNRLWLAEADSAQTRDRIFSAESRMRAIEEKAWQHQRKKVVRRPSHNLYAHLYIDDGGLGTPSYPIPYSCVIQVYDSNGNFVDNMGPWDSVGQFHYGPLLVPDGTYTLQFVPPTDGSGRVRFAAYTATVTIAGADATATILPTAATGYVSIPENRDYPLSKNFQAVHSSYGTFTVPFVTSNTSPISAFGGGYQWLLQTTISYPGFGIGAVGCAPRANEPFYLASMPSMTGSPALAVLFGYEDTTGTGSCPLPGGGLYTTFLSGVTCPKPLGASAPVNIVATFTASTPADQAYRINMGPTPRTITFTEL